jgi:hypothetical protein
MQNSISPCIESISSALDSFGSMRVSLLRTTNRVNLNMFSNRIFQNRRHLKSADMFMYLRFSEVLSSLDLICTNIFRCAIYTFVGVSGYFLIHKLTNFLGIQSNINGVILHVHHYLSSYD